MKKKKEIRNQTIGSMDARIIKQIKKGQVKKKIEIKRWGLIRKRERKKRETKNEEEEERKRDKREEEEIFGCFLSKKRRIRKQENILKIHKSIIAAHSST